MKRFAHSLTPVLTIAGAGDSLANSDKAVEDGEMIFVRSTRQVFAYENPSVQVPDGVTIVASNFGAGNWILVPTGGGASYSGYYNTASAGALASGRLLDVTLGFLGALSDGTKVWVRSVRDSYTWYATRADVADGLLVVNPTSNGVNPGRFIRDLVASPTWMTQATWFVDPVNGNDENLGAAAGAGNALKTDGERQRRWGLNQQVRLTQLTTVTYSSSLPNTDPVNYNVILANGGDLALVGTMAVVKSSTLLAVTALNRGTQTPWSFTSTTAFDGSEVGNLIRISGGARVGNNFWVVKNNGAGSIRTTSPGIGSPAGFSFTLATPVNGDPYDLLAPVRAYVGAIKVMDEAVDTYANHIVTMDGLYLDGGSSFGSSILMEGPFFMPTRCRFNSVEWLPASANGPLILGCVLSGQININTTMSFYGGGAMNAANVVTSSGAALISLDGDFLLQNARAVGNGGVWKFGFVAGFDTASTPPFEFDYGAWAQSVNINYGGNLLWGNNNSGFGVKVHARAMLTYGTKPTVTGSTTDCNVGGTNKAWGAIPYIEPANNAAIVPYA